LSTVSIDFETRSLVELKATGVYPYAAHASTSLWCMAYAFDDEEPELWIPGQAFPERLLMHIAQGGELRAWNAQFERVMWRDCAQRLYGFPEVQLEQWICSAAEAAAMALPRSLDRCARVTGVAQQKDSAGYNLMLRMCRPRKVLEDGTVIWWEPQEGMTDAQRADIAERQSRLYQYCQQDVRTERAIARVLRRLPEKEREVYLLDQRINDRGIRFDRQLAMAAKEVVNLALEDANEQLAEVTGGKVVGVTKRAAMVEWLREQGLEVTSIDKASVSDMLSTDLPPHVRTALEARQEAGKSSIAKIDAMIAAASEDDRLRGLLLYHGASTGRWTGRLVQPQNFPRGEVENIERYIEIVREGKVKYDLLDLLHSPVAVVSSMLRAMLIPAPGHQFFAGDFSAIEARVLNWLAGQDDVTEQFRKFDRTKTKEDDIYVLNAMRILGLDIADVQKFPHRQLGKFQELGCGYQMGWRKAIIAAKDVYGVDLEAMYGPAEVNKKGSPVGGAALKAYEIVEQYRNTHSDVVDYWYACERAAMKAVEEPGRMVAVGPDDRQVRFKVSGKYLWLRLPSGRLLCYPRPAIKDVMTPWGEERPAVVAWSVDSTTKQWEERPYYGGLWVENIVQAVSRDLMVEAIQRLEAGGYPCVLSVHDEIVCEAPLGFGSVRDFESLMAFPPQWAQGCPIGTEAWQGERYQK
jgi:DNA polymerase